MAKSYSLRPLCLFGLLLLLCAFGIASQSSQSEASSGSAGSSRSMPLFDSLPSWGPDIRVITDTGCLAPRADRPDTGWQIEKIQLNTTITRNRHSTPCCERYTPAITANRRLQTDVRYSRSQLSQLPDRIVARLVDKHLRLVRRSQR